MIAKIERDVATVDLLGFLYRLKRIEDIILLKLTRAIVLLLVETNSQKYYKYLKRENSK